MNIRQNIGQSLAGMRSNLFRASVTIFIIALGITALVGVLTSIDGIKEGFRSSFSRLGANTLRIENWSSEVQSDNRRGRKRQYYPPITYREYEAFKEDFSHSAIVSVEGRGGNGLTVKYREEETNQDVSLMGVDENYPLTSRYEILEGRFIIEDDIRWARNVAVIGYEIAEKLFPYQSAIGKVVTVGKDMYKVVGVYDKIGSSSLGNQDKIVTIPITTLRSHDPSLGSLTINLYTADPTRVGYLTEEATGAFRLVRNLDVREENDFSITKSDAFVERIMENLKVLTLSAQIIAFITLLGASVALLNVMLVSVTERTNEIGLRKALGATERNIRQQFLMEAVMICQLGGIMGIIFGLVVGNIVSTFLLQGGFVVPWVWLFIGLFACFVVGIASGFYPAWKASRVDPIESLRHE